MLNKTLMLLAVFMFALTSPIAQAEEPTDAAAEPVVGAIEFDEKAFGCLRKMTPVREFFVDNLIGDMDGTLAVANSETGGVYPPGSVVQLVPGEVMVKHGEGYNAATKDWEFVELDVNEEGSSIRNRGFVDVINRLGGNCFACHIKAKPEWDLICEKDHGCDPLDIPDQVLKLLQKTDPRCDDNPELTDAEKQVLGGFMKAIAEQAAAAAEAS